MGKARSGEVEKQRVVLVLPRSNPLCEEKELLLVGFLIFFFFLIASKMGMLNSAVISEQRLSLWVVKLVY